MILLTVFFASILQLSSSVSIYETGSNLDHGLGLGAYSQYIGAYSQHLGDDTQGHEQEGTQAIAYLMSMSLFGQSAALVDLSQGSLQEQTDLSLIGHQSGDASYLGLAADDKTQANQEAASENEEPDEMYGSAGTGVGALNLGEAGVAASNQSSGPFINSYGHSSSGSSNWVPIKNPHRYH